MKFDATANGVFSISPTAFHPNGAVDEDSMDRLTDFYFEVGCKGITVLGIMGEAHKLDSSEALDIVKRMIRRANGAPIIVGVSSPSFAAMRALARSSMDAGAAGVMIAPLPSLRTDEQITAYFRQAVEAIGEDVPWVLQDYPLTLTVVMTVRVIRQIITENPSCVMLKEEDWPSLEKITALREFEKDGTLRPISMLTANGALFLDFEMERGSQGAMTGYAFPDMLVDVVRLSREGNREAVHDLFDAHLPLIRYEQQPAIGLAVRKYVLQRRGILASDAQRKPGSALSATGKAEVEYLLGRLARADSRAALK